MSRSVILDTETTGFSYSKGDRLIEFGGIELINGKKTGRVLHFYVDPEREVPEGAFQVHGWDRESLIEVSKGRTFKDHAITVLNFLKGAELIIHNASFDLGFLDNELIRAGVFSQNESLRNYCTITDTIKLAKLKHPNIRHNLNNLCRIYDISIEGRELHGALLDAELLYHVYKGLLQEQYDVLESSNSDKIDSSALSVNVISINKKAVDPKISKELPLI